MTFGTAWDYDNESLTDNLYRDDKTPAIYTTTVKTNFWTVPSVNFVDNGLAPGPSHFSQVKITDRFGNSRWSSGAARVTVR